MHFAHGLESELLQEIRFEEKLGLTATKQKTTTAAITTPSGESTTTNEYSAHGKSLSLHPPPSFAMMIILRRTDKDHNPDL